MNRHFTVAVFVVYQNKTLLHWHKKLAQWFPVGGHVDPGESLCEAAIRETKEESGLEVELYQARPFPFEVFGHIKTLVAPIHIQHEYMNDDHIHMDAMFYARAKTDELHPMEGEAISAFLQTTKTAITRIPTGGIQTWQKRELASEEFLTFSSNCRN